MTHFSYIKYLVIVGFMFLFSCDKVKIEPVETYPDPPKALVKFLQEAPVPSIGVGGSIVTFKVQGLENKKPNEFTFYINQEPAEVIEVGTNTVKVKVPFTATTGGCAILINGEYYFGPTFTIRGSVSIDPSFDISGSSTNGAINGIIPIGSEYLVYGNFTNYGNKSSEAEPINSIVRINANGSFVSRFVKGQGFNGLVNDIIPVNDQYLVAGSFSKVDKMENINGLVRLNGDGTLDTNKVDIIDANPDSSLYNPDAGKMMVSHFNGGVGSGEPRRLFYDGIGKIVCVGNFKTYLSTFYERSTKDRPYLDVLDVYQIMRMDINGAFDSTYNLDKSRTPPRGYSGGNGYVFDAIQLSNGKTILVGNFTRFNDQAANYITCIEPQNGKVDAGFNSGNGADGPITRITYNSVTNKILLSGNFKTYKGVPADGVVMINEDGSIDPSFKFGRLGEGLVTYAGQLKDGRIIVSGTFNSYDNPDPNNPGTYEKIIRPGLMILHPDGSLVENCNNFGLFRGQINSFIEFPESLGTLPIILVGSFDRFNGKEVGNIVKFFIKKY